MAPACLSAFSILGVVLLLLAACTTQYPLGQTHQSDFTYPESEVTPLQNVYGEVTETTLGPPIFFTGEMKQRAIDNALEQVPDSNVLINYFESVKIVSIPLLPIATTTYSVQGVAAKAEIK